MPSGSGEVPSWRCFGGLPRAFHLAAAEDDDEDDAIDGRWLPLRGAAGRSRRAGRSRCGGAGVLGADGSWRAGGELAGTEAEAEAVVAI